ncbi:MAG: F0F1 ATP synthase subunit beta, partial [Planctomycetes bacterium]|nr:F0F1 ATP synthase subunit beta [Planctomycetota bacterium]
MSEKSKGKVIQVIGPVVDVEFPEGGLPEIYDALKLKNDSTNSILTLEVQQHLGRNQVRAIALASTDGIIRGTPVDNTGAAISVPVGEPTLGRIFNLLGDPIDERGPCNAKEYRPIHQKAPQFTSLGTRVEILETGIKVIDLIEPYPKGGKI